MYYWVDRYLRTLYSNHYKEVNGDKSPFMELALGVAHDSNFTYANLVYREQSVAMACVIVACSFYNLPHLFTEEPDLGHCTPDLF